MHSMADISSRELSAYIDCAGHACSFLTEGRPFEYSHLQRRVDRFARTMVQSVDLEREIGTGNTEVVQVSPGWFTLRPDALIVRP